VPNSFDPIMKAIGKVFYNTKCMILPNPLFTIFVGLQFKDKNEIMRKRVLLFIIQMINNIKKDGEKLYSFIELLNQYNFFNLLKTINISTKIDDPYMGRLLTLKEAMDY
jgi:hypothetical protein